MKIVTWNVNGIRACMDKGLTDYIKSTDADIIAFQETKVSTMMPNDFIPGYKAVWNNGERPGYSGTMCLYREEPLAATYGFGNKKYDKEGRLITLEYPAFFFVNVYVPQSQDNLERWNYRLEWDKLFAKHLEKLQKNKAIIVCGDFNVARDYIDIYPENLRNLEKPYGFLSEERDGFNAILDTGLIDVFRELNPEQEGAYTWWSNRLKKRNQNRGWRLDYFLATKSLLKHIGHCGIRAEVRGSDHAPVELVIDISNVDNEAMMKAWREINWQKAEKELSAMQRITAFAAAKNDKRGVTIAQKRIINSFEAKALAVRHVSSSTSQPGIDGIKWETDADKMRAVLALDTKEYKAKPMRLVIIVPKNQAKERYVQIPTQSDKAMQTLHAYTLDPVSESTGDRMSFAFRKGRSTQDAHAYIMKMFNTNEPPRYVLKGDVKACYASISHEWLLDNIPMNSHVLREFLKAGHVFRDELFPPDDFGISLGSSISAILGNMTLDGAQDAIRKGLHGRLYDVDYADGDLIRFADDILVTARTAESAEKIMAILGDFLAMRGLVLSDAKTKIVDITDGFDFLSRHYHYTDGIMHASPSDNAVAKIECKIRDMITGYKGGQKALIEKLNRVLIGWAGYHKVTEASQAFRHIDNVVKALLLELCEKLNPCLVRDKLIKKYFYKEPDGEYVYALPNKRDIRIQRIAETILIEHKPVAVKKNPYIDIDYYEERSEDRAVMTVTGKYKTVWKRQNGRCVYCGNDILRDSKKAVVPINPSLPPKPKNMAYIHDCCSTGQAEFYESDREVESEFDLYELLVRMNGGNNACIGRRSKYYSLKEHFRKRSEAVFTLTFKEIGEIIGKPLCPSAYSRRQYWQSRGDNFISTCWLTNGYAIKNLYFDKAYVVFERKTDAGVTVNIPPVFLNGRIPHRAKVEFENMCEYIKKKYGL